mmetsp:Transcript_27606/g.108193  ORF Transcript_27606/g.108193 Transcript_27606/m.108193 type:complete len:84 (+) Transcript_27606:171-422(+)
MNGEEIKICCIGAGYVGGPTMAKIAEKCPEIPVTVRGKKIVLGQMDVRCWDLVHVCIFLLAEKKRIRVLWGFWCLRFSRCDPW